MADIFSAISNIRLIAIAVAIIAVVAIVWKFSNDLKGFNPFGSGDSTTDVIRDEIDETEQSIKTEQLAQKGQIIDQIDAARDIILDKEQNTTEQVKRVVEKENAESEAAILDEMADFEARITARLKLSESPEEDAETLSRLTDIWARIQNDEMVESWELVEINDALTSGAVTINKATGDITSNL